MTGSKRLQKHGTGREALRTVLAAKEVRFRGEKKENSKLATWSAL